MDKIKNVLISNKYICFLILISFFKPLLLYYYHTINFLFNIWTMFNGILILLIFISDFFKTKKVSPIIISIIVYFLCLLLSTIIKSKDIVTYLKKYLKLFALLYYTKILLNDEKGKIILLKELRNLVCTYVFLNTVVAFVFPNGIVNPDGLTAVYFLGNDNTTTLFITFGLLFLLIYATLFKNKKNMIVFMILLILCNVVYFRDWSMTSIVGIIMVDIYFVVFYPFKNRNIKFLNINMYAIICVVFFVLVSLIRIQNYFQPTIEKITHKSITFTGRTAIWDRSLEQFNDNKIIGIGVEENEKRLERINIYHAHSTYINILMESGIIGAFSVTEIIILLSKKLKLSNRINRIVAYAFLVFGIIGIVEVYQDCQMLYIFIIFAFYNEKLLINDKKMLQEKKGIEKINEEKNFSNN